MLAGRTARRVWPRRCSGAVQPPAQLPGGVVEIWGWAWFARDELASCCVTIDGQAVATAVLGAAPPDVAAARYRAARSKRCGWRAQVNLTKWTGRDVVVGALATSERGATQELASARVTVVTPRRRSAHTPIGRPGGIEGPPPGTVVHTGRLSISGWVLADRAPLDRLEVRVNGGDAGYARPFATPRPEIARTHDVEMPLAGFEHLVTLDGRPGDRVQLDVELVGSDGGRTPLAGTEVVIGPAASVTLPRPVSNVLGALPEPRAASNGQARRPRVVAYTHNLLFGGAQLYLQELLRDLIKNHDVPCLVVSGLDGPLREELEMLGAAVHVTDYPLPDRPTYEARCVELAVMARTFGATVAVVNTLVAGIGADAARLLDIPTIWAVHESYALDDYWTIASGETKGPALAAATRQSLQDASLVLFESDATRAAYQQEVDGGRLATLYYGIDLSALEQFARSIDRAQARRLVGLRDDETVLVCVGVFEPRKAQAMLAAAFARLADEFPSARLVMVGETESDYSRAVGEFVEGLDLDGRVRLEPVEANPYRWFRAADAFVMASDLESMPRVLLEAMAFELPVVAADVWGVPELVRHGDTGILFPPRDVAALTDALRTVLRMDAMQRAALGRRAAQLVRARHDLADYRTTFADLIRRLTADPGAGPATLTDTLTASSACSPGR